MVFILLFFFFSFEFSNFDFAFPIFLSLFLGADLQNHPAGNGPTPTDGVINTGGQPWATVCTGYHSWVFLGATATRWMWYTSVELGARRFVFWFDRATCLSGMFHIMAEVGERGTRVMFYDGPPWTTGNSG